MTPYETQTKAIRRTLEVLDAAADTAADQDDAEDVELFVTAARDLRSAFNLPQPQYPVVLALDEEDSE